MKTITKFFRGLANVNNDIKQCADLAWLDIFPATTTKLAEWFEQFGLKDNGILSEEQKREKLAGAWQATGSLSPRYLQDLLQGQGFDLYVHEWWEPGTEPPVGINACVAPRSPLVYLQQGDGGVTSGVECGEAAAACGEAFAECGNTFAGPGYPLVNKITRTEPDFIVECGEAEAECGEAFAECGSYLDFREVQQNYIIPDDPDKWPYFVYIGAQTFPGLAIIDGTRRDEVEELLLKYCPAHMWIGVLVSYT